MERLREMLDQDPCYEQHIVSIKKIYEDYLVDILCPVIYEGIQSMYKKSLSIEKKYIECGKKNPNIENPGIEHIFKKILRDIPELNSHKVKKETDRIRSVSKIADIFDDLIKAVIRSNIILITYNVDNKRREIDSSKYHENVNISEFIHNCYIHSARLFHQSPELLTNKIHKSKCDNVIKDAIHNSIKLMLPMKEILLEYLTQKYEQRDDHQHHELVRHTFKDIMKEAIREELGNGLMGELKGGINGSLLEDELFDTPIRYKNENPNIYGSVLESDRFEAEIKIINPPPNNIFTIDKKKDTLPDDFVDIDSLISRNRSKQPDIAELPNNHDDIDINHQYVEPVNKTNNDDNHIIITHSSDRANHITPNNVRIKMIDMTNTLNTNKKTAKLYNDMIPEINNRYNEHIGKKNSNLNKLSTPIRIEQNAEKIKSEKIQSEKIQSEKRQSEKEITMERKEESMHIAKLIDRILT